MKVVSINTARPREVTYQGKSVTTGIFKTPNNHRVYVYHTNLDGDGQSDLINHGGEHKAVYAFSAHHYDYWRKALSNPELSCGAFGENLTISDLYESRLCIGDTLLIGETILEVSQPRVPCFKLAIALQDSKIPNLFTKSFATGIYFRVKQQGFITPDDEVKVIKNSSDSVSVQALFRAYFDRSYTDSVNVLKTALDIAELAPEWREKVIKKLSNTR